VFWCHDSQLNDIRHNNTQRSIKWDYEHKQQHLVTRPVMLSVLMLSVLMLSVLMLSVLMLSVVMPSVVMLSVVMLSVVAPLS
jgi:hypothetical protein